MKVSVEFKNGMCRLLLTPDDEWEQHLVGAVAKGGEKLEALVTYKTEGHFTHAKCKAVTIQLEAAGVDAPNSITTTW